MNIYVYIYIFFSHMHIHIHKYIYIYTYRVIRVICIVFGVCNESRSLGNGNLWKVFIHSIFGESSIWIFLLKFIWYVDFVKVEISCSTSPPGGNQVDGLPPAFNRKFFKVTHWTEHRISKKNSNLNLEIQKSFIAFCLFIKENEFISLHS